MLKSFHLFEKFSRGISEHARLRPSENPLGRWHREGVAWGIDQLLLASVTPVTLLPQDRADNSLVEAIIPGHRRAPAVLRDEVREKWRRVLDEELGAVAKNEQTFDADTVSSDWIKDTVLLDSQVDDVNRIFGPDAHRDLESDSHFLNSSYSGLPIGKITAFAYFLDFARADEQSSSNTAGLPRQGGLPRHPALLAADGGEVLIVI